MIKLFYKTAKQTYHHPIQNVSKRLTLYHHWRHRIDWRQHHNVNHLIHQSLFISTRHTIMTSFIVDCTLSVTSLALGISAAPREDSNHHHHAPPQRHQITIQLSIQQWNQARYSSLKHSHQIHPIIMTIWWRGYTPSFIRQRNMITSHLHI